MDFPALIATFDGEIGILAFIQGPESINLALQGSENGLHVPNQTIQQMHVAFTAILVIENFLQMYRRSFILSHGVYTRSG